MQRGRAGCRAGMHGGVCGEFYMHTGAEFWAGGGFQSNLQHILATQDFGLIKEKNHEKSTKRTSANGWLPKGTEEKAPSLMFLMRSE